MIGFLPEIYPDELVYSFLARYYVRSGYLSYNAVAEELYINKKVGPDMELLNTFTKETLNAITKNYPLEYLIKNHTMFNYYARFIKHEKRKQAFNAMMKMEGGYYNLLSIPISKEKRYLRYCPICVTEDREKYGETYWHRIHQMMRVNICSIHKCYLLDSPVLKVKYANASLKPAETEIEKENEVIMSDNELECQISQYVTDVFNSDVDINNEVNAGDFLHSKMSYTKYRSVRGERRNISLLYGDFCKYYERLKDNSITGRYQFESILINDRINTYEICLIAQFLNISASELIHMKLPEKTQEEFFDEEVKRLRRQGLKFREIAEEMNISYGAVRYICEEKYGKPKKEREKGKLKGKKLKDWEKADRETLLEVKEVIRVLRGNEQIKPKRITVSAVAKNLGVHDMTLRKLPMCKKEIDKCYESYEEYWARKVEWAVKKIQEEGQTLTLTWILKYTNMRKKNFEACVPYLGEELRKEIQNLV